MADMHQEVYIKWGIGVPKLKGRLKPIIMAPIRRLLTPPVKDPLQDYINPEPVRPVLPTAIEPPIKEPIQPIIPDYIGDPNEQPTQIHKEPFTDAPADKDREIPADDETAPLKL